MANPSKFDDREGEIIKVYQDVLSGKLKKFPHGYWSPDDINARGRLRVCFRWYAETHGLTRDDILGFGTEDLRDIKLRSPISMAMPLFDSVYDLINYVFDDYEISRYERVNKSWYADNMKTAISAIRWLFLEKLQMSKEQIEEHPGLGELFTDNGFANALKMFRKFGVDITIYDALRTALPEFHLDFSNGERYSSGRDTSVALQAYIAVLNGVRPMLPYGFWRADDAKDRAKDCVRYIMSIVCVTVDRDSVLKMLTASLLKTKGLSTLIQAKSQFKVFLSMYELVAYCYPEFHFTENEFVAGKRTSSRLADNL